MRKTAVQNLLVSLVCLTWNVPTQMRLAAKSNFLVLGVIASGDHKAGIALIKSEASGTTFAARSGQELGPGTQITRISRDYVYFVIDGRENKVRVGEDTASSDSSSPTAYADIDHLSKGVERVGSTVRISSELREELTSRQLSRVLMQAAAMPYYEEGRLSGFKLLAIDVGSIYDKVGFKDGDIVTTVNGHKLSDVAMTIKLLQGMKDAKSADVSFRRGGAEQSLTLEIQ